MPTQIISDHHLKGPSGPCLKLLSDGEEFEYPAYQIPREDVDDLANEIVLQDVSPRCTLCRIPALGWGAKPRYSDIPSAELPGNVDVISHHMFTK